MKGNRYSQWLAAVCVFISMFTHTACAAPSVQDNARQFFDDEMTTLLVGEQSVAVFPSPSAIPLKRGVAVLFYETGSLGLTFDVAAQIGNRLNRHGWQTLLVPALFTPPPGSGATAQAGAPATANADAGVDDFSYRDSRTRFTQLLNAVEQHLADEDGFRLVIAQGMTAALLLDTGSQDAITAPDTAVVLSPFWPAREHNQAVADNLANTAFPVLDIALGEFNNWALSTRHNRSQRARTALKMHYRQQVMLALGTSAIARTTSYTGRQLQDSLAPTSSVSAAAASPFATRLASRVYGWTAYLGW